MSSIRYVRFLLLLWAGSWGLVGCDRIVDDTPPTIEVEIFPRNPTYWEICGEERPDVLTFGTGDTLYAQVTFRDDRSLFEYSIDFSSNFDCRLVDEAEDLIDPIEVGEFGTTELVVEYSRDIPLDMAAGAYLLHIQANDDDRNKSLPIYTYDIRIFNRIDSIPPALTVNAPQFSNLTVAKGNSLRIAGEVSDNSFLGAGDYGRLLLSFQEIGEERQYDAYELRWFGTENLVEPFDARYEIPESLTAGDYVFTLRAFDAYNNESESFQYEVEIVD